MLGAIIGDIVGSRWEFNPTNDYNFELFSDKNDFTDDTICTIAVADAILHGSEDYGKYIHMWCRKYPHPMGGYGCSFARWVASDNPKPYNSFGNGSAMRVSPIGWWFEDGIWEQAEKCATCTHNHEFGIQGAQAVAWAIRDGRVFRQENKGKPFTKLDIDHALMVYSGFSQDFKVNIEDYRNKFDETCQGTVPVALAIILESNGFEDAIRRAVSLGADADTLGAIVGSIAEAIWGIPEWMKEKALSYLPNEMVAVVKEFHKRLNRLRKLTKQCKYYKVGDWVSYKDHEEAYTIERSWAQDLAKSYSYADKAKERLKEFDGSIDWRAEYADVYELPLSLIGYIATHVTEGEQCFLEAKLDSFLNTHYKALHPKPQKKAGSSLDEFKAIMYWKLCLGNSSKSLFGDDSVSNKSNIPTVEMIADVKQLPDDSEDVSTYPLSIPISKEDIAILKMGHIPEAMEDHWFMYTDDQYIRYVRSWSNTCVFEAHYKADGDNYVIDSLRMSHSLAQFGVNGDEAGVFLFRYLVITEIGGDSHAAWQAYLNAWEELHQKYLKQNNI